MLPAQAQAEAQRALAAKRDAAAELRAQHGANRVGRLLRHIEVQRVRTRLGEGVLRRDAGLEARERRERSHRPDAELVAGLDLGQELVGARAARRRALLQPRDLDLPLQLVVEVGVADKSVGVEARPRTHGREAAVGRDADRIGPALAHERVHPLGAVGVADAKADQEARVEAIVDAGRGAADIVGQGRAVAVALHRAQPTQAAEPGAERTCFVARLDLARLGQRHARARRAAAARQRHLLAERVHEQRGVGHVGRAEVGIGLTADGVERRRALLGAEPGQRADHRGEVAGGVGEGLVQRIADVALVHRVAAEAREGVALQGQGQEHVVGVVGERRRQEREVAADAGIGAADTPPVALRMV